MVALHGGHDHIDRGFVVLRLELGSVPVAAGGQVSPHFFVLFDWLSVWCNCVYGGGLDWRG